LPRLKYTVHFTIGNSHRGKTGVQNNRQQLWGTTSVEFLYLDARILGLSSILLFSMRHFKISILKVKSNETNSTKP